MDFQGPSDQYITFTVAVPSDGEYRLQVGYTRATEDHPLQLSVNGGVVGAAQQDGYEYDGLVHFSPDYMLTGVVPVTLTAGANTITLTTVGLGGASIDGLFLASGPPGSMSGNTAGAGSAGGGGGGHRRQQATTFLTEMVQEDPECPWDSIDEKVVAISAACCSGTEPSRFVPQRRPES